MGLQIQLLRRIVDIQIWIEKEIAANFLLRNNHCWDEMCFLHIYYMEYFALLLKIKIYI